MFTGWTEERLSRSNLLGELYESFYLSEAMVNTVVAGPFVSRLACDEDPLISSTNQVVLNITAPLEQKNEFRVEVHCEGDSIKITGLPNKQILSALTEVKL